MYHQSTRRAILTIFDYLGSMRKAAILMKVSVASICRWSRDRDATLTRPHRKHRSGKLTDAIMASVRMFMQKETRVSSWEIVGHVQEMYGISISRQLANLVIHRLGYTFKRTRKRGTSQRKESAVPPFLVEFMTAYEDLNIASIDESGFDQRPVPVYGYASAGKPAIVRWKPSSNRTRYNLLMSIHNDGSHAKTIHDRPVNGEKFAEFIRGLPYCQGTALLMDNASIHKTLAVKAAMELKGFIPIYVPPYSPEFNPIELVFGIIKNDFYRSRYNGAFDDLYKATLGCTTNNVLPRTVQNCFRHVADLVEHIANS